MSGFPSPFSGSGGDIFDEYDEFVPEHMPESGPFLKDHDVLSQSHTLTIGSFRAWNGLTDQHDYDLVRVQAHPMHHKSAEINDELTRIEKEFLETGEVRRVSPSADMTMSNWDIIAGQTSDSPDTPF